MGEIRCMITEASKKIEVETHVLRYWEDELELPISRNELGHRYYRETDIELLKTIKKLKEQGFQLKAVKMLLPNIDKLDSLNPQTMVKLKDELNERVFGMEEMDKKLETDEETSLITSEIKNDMEEQSQDKMMQFKTVMMQLITAVLKDNNAQLAQEISTSVTDGVTKEVNYLLKLQEEKEEERYKKFDITLRDYQKSRTFAAATSEGKNKKKSKFFKKNRAYI